MSPSSDFRGTNSGQEFEAASRQLRALHIDDRVNIIDVGSNNGAWFGQLSEHPGITVTSAVLIEPIPDFYEVAHKTYQADSAVQVLNVAVGETLRGRETAIARIGLGGRRHKVPSRMDGDLDVELFRIELRTGDEIVQELGFPVNFLKVDCDGDDFTVLRSFEETLQTFRPLVLFEHSSQFARRAGYRLGHVVAWFDKLGYGVRVVERDGGLARIRTSRFEVGPFQTRNFLAIPSW